MNEELLFIKRQHKGTEISHRMKIGIFNKYNQQRASIHNNNELLRIYKKYT